MNYQAAAQRIASLVTEKQAAYGDSFGRSGAVLRELYPNGIKPDQYDDLLTIARVLDKLFRIANDKGYGGESPWADINGYSLLALAKEETSIDPGRVPEEPFYFGDATIGRAPTVVTAPNCGCSSACSRAILNKVEVVLRSPLGRSIIQRAAK